MDDALFTSLSTLSKLPAEEEEAKEEDIAMGESVDMERWRWDLNEDMEEKEEEEKRRVWRTVFKNSREEREPEYRSGGRLSAAVRTATVQVTPLEATRRGQKGHLHHTTTTTAAATK